MFSLTLLVGPNGTPMSFLFKTKEAAEKADRLVATHGDVIVLKDDFGQQATLKSAAVCASLFEDMDLGSEAAIERGLQQARTQARGQQRAQADNVLKFAAGPPFRT